MIDAVKHALTQQYHAALSTLEACVDACPDSVWNGPIANLAFCQVAFHAIFFTDYYLGDDENSLREQPFHRDNQELFRDYEELEPRQQVLRYDKPDIKNYLQHCRRKATEVIAAETADSLCEPCRFTRKNISRLELHIYNIRHIQHHAAQLSLRLRLDAKGEIPWVRSGWLLSG